MRYGRFGTMRTRAGQRDAVVRILLRDVAALEDAGCDLYIVTVTEQDADAISVMEVWRSSEAHRASLSLPTVRAAIAEALPLLTGEFESRDFEVAGGLGLPASAA
jgi:quinol monooxygenase YgiN